MRVSYKNSFLSDLKTIRDSKTLERIRTKIDELVLAENPGDFRNTKKLKVQKMLTE
jgi:putative component of toxin-antitoxin plasmid stabilization module